MTRLLRLLVVLAAPAWLAGCGEDAIHEVEMPAVVRRIDLGRVFVDERPVGFQVRGRNTTQDWVTIHSVSVDCGCIKSRASPPRVACGADYELPYTLRIAKPGPSTYRIHVRFQSESGETVLAGVATVVVNGQLAVEAKPSTAFVDESPDGSVASCQFEIQSNRGGELTFISASGLPRGCELTSRSVDGKVVASVEIPHSLFDAIRGFFVAVRVSENGRSVDVLLSVRLVKRRGVFWVSGGRVNLGYVRGGVARRTVVVKCEEPDLSLQEIEVELSGIAGSVELSRLSASKFSLEIALDKPARSVGRLDALVTIQISNDNKSKSTIPCSVRFAQ